MASSLAELLRAMLYEAQSNVFKLRQYAEETNESPQLRHICMNVLHSELLRLDMLHDVVAEVGPS